MNDDPKTLKDDIPSAGQTRFSTISGAIGNYGMWAAAVSFVGQLGYDMACKKGNRVLDRATLVSVAVTGVGAAFGAIHGVKEANEIEHYRNAIAAKIDGLEQHATANRQKIDALNAALAAKEPVHLR